MTERLGASENMRSSKSKIYPRGNMSARLSFTFTIVNVTYIWTLCARQHVLIFLRSDCLVARGVSLLSWTCKFVASNPEAEGKDY